MTLCYHIKNWFIRVHFAIKKQFWLYIDQATKLQSRAEARQLGAKPLGEECLKGLLFFQRNVLIVGEQQRKLKGGGKEESKQTLRL